MNRESERPTHERTPAAGRVYQSADDLLRDLGGDTGPQARALATGYWMAIHDADAGYLTATELLKYLQSETGSLAELTGLGYVQAVRDCAEAGQARRLPAEGAAGEAAARRDAACVRAWLEHRPATVMQPALTAVQLALAGSQERGPARRPDAVAPATRLGAIGAQSRVAKGMAVAACALVLVVVVQQVSSSRAAARAAAFDLAVGRQAEYMTAMLLEQRRYEKDSILNMADPAESEAYAGQWEKARVAMQSTIDTLGAANLADEDRQSLLEIRDDSRRYEQGYLQVLTQMRQGRVRSPQEANRMLEDYKPAAHRAEVNGVLLATRAMQRLHQ